MVDAAEAWPAETYASHALARWAWRAHEFLVALLLVELRPESLRAVAVYGVVDNAARLVLAPAAGALVDRAGRLEGASLMLLLQNASVLSSACAAAWALSSPPPPSPLQLWPLLAVVVAGGALAGVGSAGAALAVEREWPAAVAASLADADADTDAPPHLLSRINSRMRAIDLGCQLMAPAAAGLVMSALGARAAALASAAFCALAWPPQVLLLRSAVRRSEALSAPKTSKTGPQDASEAAVPTPSTAPPGSGGALAAYFRQRPLLPSLALALLYCTVLSLGIMMTAFLKARGAMSEASIAAGRGAGALSGIGAALLFPSVAGLLERRRRGRGGGGGGGGGGGDGAIAGVADAGLCGVLWQLGTLLAGAAPTLLAAAAAAGSGGSGGGGGGGGGRGGSNSDLWALVAGLVASRAGLWTFDLAITQLQQELVAPEDQASVGGVQAALQAGFELLSFCAAALRPRPQEFPLLIALSLAVVAAAALVYARWWWWAYGAGAAGAAAARHDEPPLFEDEEEEWHVGRAELLLSESEAATPRQ